MVHLELQARINKINPTKNKKYEYTIKRLGIFISFIVSKSIEESQRKTPGKINIKKRYKANQIPGLISKSIYI